MKIERRRAPKVASVVIASLLALGAASCGASGESTDDNVNTSTSSVPLTPPTVGTSQEDQLQIVLKPIKTDDAMKFGDQEFSNEDRSYEGKVLCGTQSATSVVLKVTKVKGKLIDTDMSVIDLDSKACEDRYLTKEEAEDTVISFISANWDD